MPSHPCVDVPQVIKYESVIHEFDPYFNYRITQVTFRWRSIHCLLWSWLRAQCYCSLERVLVLGLRSFGKISVVG